MPAKWLCLWLLGVMIELSVEEGQLLNIYSPVDATASSSYGSDTEETFSPQLAIQADTSDVGRPCYISDKETNPWFRLDFKEIKTIFNVRLVVKEKPSDDLPSGFSLKGMDQLTVYVSNISSLNKDDKKLRCGDSWKFNNSNRRDIILDCESGLEGRFLYVTVPSSSRTYLMICCIVLNQKSGPLKVPMDRATVASSQSDSYQHPERLIDGNYSSCSMIPVVSNAVAWVRIDIQSVHYVKTVSILFHENRNHTVLVGRSLKENGFVNNILFSPVSANRSWNTFTSSQPVLGQFIYIQSPDTSMHICEITASYEDILNIYSPVKVSASDENMKSSPIWTPVDGLEDNRVFISRKASNSWWRLEFPTSYAISRVDIHAAKLSFNEQSRLDGFAVYIGDSLDGNGIKNKRCGEPWIAEKDKDKYNKSFLQVTRNCSRNTVGKYLYVAADDSTDAKISLSEIFVYGCEVPNVDITASQTANLTCNAEIEGCHLTEITWTGPDGNEINRIIYDAHSNVTAGSFVVESDRFGGRHTCNVTYEWGSVTKHYNVSVKPVVRLEPTVLTVVDGKMASPLFCVVSGYPLPTITWRRNNVTVLEGITNHTNKTTTSFGQNLRIGTVSLSSNGTVYSCEATQFQEREVSRSNSTLLVTPNMAISSLSRYVVGIVGDQVTLTCYGEGKSVDTIEWMADGNKISFNSTHSSDSKPVNGRHTSSLTIKNLQLFHGSIRYQCIAKNSFLSTLEDSAIIKIQILGNITKFKDEAYDIGQSLQNPLSCVFTANPKPNAVLQLSNNTVVGTTVRFKGNHEYSISLPIRTLGPDDTGIYSCLVSFEGSSKNLSSTAQLQAFSKVGITPEGEINITEAKTVHLICKAFGFPKPNVTWIRSRASRNVNITVNPSVSSDDFDSTTVSNLTLIEAYLNEAGEYTCLASNGLMRNGTAFTARSSSTKLLVSAKIDNSSTPSAVTAVWYKSTNLSCTAKGYPAPRLMWKFYGSVDLPKRSKIAYTKEDLSSSSRLTLHDVKARTHGGQYKCGTSNDAGSDYANITLKFNPRVVDPASPSVQAVVFGQKLTINCKVASYPALPPTDVSWYKNGLQITDPSVKVDRNKKISVSVIYNVKVRSVAVCGNYSCYSANSPSVAVYVSSAAFIDAKMKAVVEGGTVNLKCKAVGCPKPTISWLFSGSDNVSYKVVGSENDLQVKSQEINSTTVTGKLTIKNARRSQDGIYRCRSSNDAIANETGHTETRLIVYYVSFFNNVTSPVEAEEGKSFQLNCAPKGNPLLKEVTWMKRSFESESRETPVLDGDVSDRFSITDDSTVITLKVKDAVFKDSGYYWCHFPGVERPITSSKILVTVKGRPDPVLVSTVQVSTQAKNATLMWRDPFDGSCAILYFNVTIREGESFRVSKVTKVNDDHVNYTTVFIAGLMPYTTYIVQIVPVNKIGAAKNSEEFKLTTNVSVPSAPLNLIVSKKSSTTLFASWTEPKEPNGPIDVYNVYLQLESDVTVKHGRSISQPKPAMTVSVNNVTITDLGKYTLYHVFVTAANRDSSGYLEGPKSNIVSIRTDQDAPSAPRHVLVMAIDDKSLTVTWLPPSPANGKIEFYQVFYEESTKFSIYNFTRNLRLTINGSDRSAMLTGLSPFTEYTVAVRAYTVFFGNLSKLSVGETEQGLSSAPQNLTVVRFSSTVLALSWIPPVQPRGIILKYLISVYGRKSYIDVEGKTVEYVNEKTIMTTDEKSNFAVENLWPDSTYNVTVAAMTVKGVGTVSKAIEATTEEDIPIPPVSGVGLTPTTSTVIITLTKPSNRNGNIRYVLLLVAELKSVQTVTDIDFSSSSPKPYSESTTAGEPYVAAKFNYDLFPDTFTLGEGSSSGGYRNVPLKSGTRYAYSLRSVSATNSQWFSTSAPVSIETAKKSSSSNAAAAAGAVVTVILVIFAVVLILVILHRRRSKYRKNPEFSRPVVEKSQVDEVAMTYIEKPTVFSVQEEVDCIPGNTVVLKINVAGQPEPKIQWECSGKNLPGYEGRFELISNGFLQISNIREEDAGVYRCTVSNSAGTSQCQIKLSIVHDQKRNPVAVVDFEVHVKRLFDSDSNDFSAEFSDIGEDNLLSSVAKLKCNKSKNRYGNIVPYDNNRVVLKKLCNEPGSDYINASYVHSYDQPNGYIACQGPVDETISDFWRMVWQENVRTIVMVTNVKEKGKVKCSQYWPELNKKYLSDSIVVKFHEQISLPQCTVRTFKLMNSEDENTKHRIVQQFHFTGWPDHGVPKYATPLLKLIKRVRAHQSLQPTSPIAIHCSAGVGRTGAFIVIDYTLQKLEKEKTIDIFNLIRELRRQRPHMVQTNDQYKFCHDTVLEYVLCGDTSVLAANLQIHIRQLNTINSETGKTGFERDLEIINRISPRAETFSYSVGKEDGNAKKNRYASCIPPDEIRIYLSPVSGQQSDSSYINAATVDGYQRSKMYITTQGPLKETVGDFWRLVWDHKCHFIVMVTQLEENGKEMSAQYWPSEGTAEYAMMSVTKVKEKKLEEYTVRKFVINKNNAEASDQTTVTQFQYLSWPDCQLLRNVSQLLNMMEKLKSKQMKSETKSVIVMCSDGIHRCGIFCAISIIIEALETEQVVDVFQVVRALRLQNPLFLNSLEEYKFCYNVAQQFLDSFDTYANFKAL